MSHANVYRFFKTKSEILDAIIDEWLTKLQAIVEEIAGRRASAADRIRAVVLELHRKRKQKLKEDAGVFETYRRVIELRPEVAAQRREKVINVFRRLIDEGIAAGEFGVVDSLTAARALKDATSLFLDPILMPAAQTETTDQRAQAV